MAALEEGGKIKSYTEVLYSRSTHVVQRCCLFKCLSFLLREFLSLESSSKWSNKINLLHSEGKTLGKTLYLFFVLLMLFTYVKIK